jgi:hypothetical protein
MTAAEIKAIVREGVREALVEFMAPSDSQVEAGRILGKHPQTILRMIKDGRLVAVNGKISKEELTRQLLKP